LWTGPHTRFNRRVTTVAIIQARVGSTRLPRKVFEPFAGRSALAHCVERTRSCSAIDDVIVATTTESRDDEIVDACRVHGWRMFRGSEHDVLDRFFHAAREAAATDIVRVTSDCPLIDPDVIAGLVGCYRSAAGVDYASTAWFPLGIGAEVVRFEALARAWAEDTNPRWREHVTPYLYRNPDTFRIVSYPCERDYSHHRWTLDTPEDAALLRRIVEHLGAGPSDWRTVLRLVEAHPDWQALNANIVQRRVPVD